MRAITWGGTFCHREMSEKDTFDKTVSRRSTEGRVHIEVGKYLWGVVRNLTRQHSVYVDLQGILETGNKTENQNKISLSLMRTDLSPLLQLSNVDSCGLSFL